MRRTRRKEKGIAIMSLSSDSYKNMISRRFLTAAIVLLAGFLIAFHIPSPAEAASRKTSVASESEKKTGTASSAKTSSKRSASKWQKIGKKICYVYSTGRKATGFLKTGGRWYHFDSNGNLSRGWFTSGGSRFYGRTSGSMGGKLGSLVTGYCKISGVYYAFESTGRAGTYGKQKTGWVTTGGKTYYYYATGSKASGFTMIGTSTYYFAKTGSKRYRGRVITGWKKISKKKYYFRKNGSSGIYGSAYKNTTIKIGKKYYTFDKTGIMVGSGTTAKKAKAAASPKKLTTNEEFIEKIGALAHADMQKTGVLASVTCAQAILESNYGKSILATRANNLFGMKASLSGNNWGSSWNGKVYKKSTLEFTGGRYITIKAKFRKYSSWAQSIADHSAYLTGAMKGSRHRYAGIKGEKNYKKAAKIIKNGGYATAPTYVSSICAVIKKYKLTRFDK